MKANKFQKQLLEESRHNMFLEKPMSETTEKAFLETPRHLFIKRYRLWPSKEWREIDSNNLEEHLSTLYSNRALILWGDDNENISSTISQPSLVLHMLDMLRLEPGHRVFELGAGSGWNAALMGHIVGPKGHVYSLEIIPEVAKTASETIEALGLKNVNIIEGDGGEGYVAAAPYDRAMFTAGSFDLPAHFYAQIKEEGLLLIVFKIEGGADNLFLLKKTADHFVAIDSLCCGFVQMTGKYAIDELEPVHLETLPNWTALKNQEISRTPFWWGGKGPGFTWRTLGIRSFLSVINPLFKSFKPEKTNGLAGEENFFGLWDEHHQSLVIAKDDLLIAYGSPAAKERLLEDIKLWVDHGMPSIASFELQIYPLETPLTAGKNQWIVKRRESQFLWSLNY